MNSLTMTRRTALGLMGGGVLAAAAPAWALSPSEAEAVVARMIGEINKNVLGAASPGQASAAFEKALVTYGDVNAISRYVLGASGRGVSRGDMNKFSDAYIGYVSRKYSRRFGDFNGSDIAVLSAQKVKSFIKVNAQARLASGSKVNVEFLVSDKSGSTRVFNIFVEGVNLLLTERTEVGALLEARGGSIVRLTKDLPTL